MSLDFTFAKYKRFCEAMINSNYKILTVKEYLTSSKPDKCIILRHDVDLKPDRSLKAAEIENEFGIRSTYYFRMTDEVFQPEIIKRIAELGHEIGYHYEVLDKAKGDFAKAIEIFKRELDELRKLCDIKTICMHGNSRTEWDNRDLWRIYDFREFGIIGEAYLSVDFSKIVYFSDTARTWNPKYKVKDIPMNPANPIIDKTDELIKLIKTKEFSCIYILMHPDDWCDEFGKWLSNLIIRKFKNVGKSILKQRWKKVNKTKHV